MFNVTKIQKYEDLTKLNISELMVYEIELQSYLQTHEPDMSKQGTVDVNDRPFDRQLYEEKKQQWYSIWVEYFTRPVEEGLDIKL
ncbi:hypothetical protein A3K01_04015 [candidate division WWE3 bacterium RIFOXYD1_FULL_43_17]|uniref:Uncharacterized protein n=2 Tax=Katanobacteria TaxID=422282 RepID=A0A1F4XDX1_UNCKA|nr:MAG: hypothetical protein UR43_C0017G0029 [candidate division TM6 bacterium GW2011_GWF2_33_332]KKS03241.1 MAG: hypothetical protein UU55_C0004G0030 [candidate division WWE3 bacterium GW2011_GWC2_41_23]OGC79864.1 MAG: hypothetical protein A3K01_04015 [candidate division WWE3 bacterium RIFOXYD1_FULL_43_17]